MLTGSDSIAKLRQRRQEISEILAEAKFPLRKWASNCPAIIAESPSIISQVEIAAEKDPKTLGLLWSTIEDVLRFSITLVTHSRVTKRTMLSQIAQIYDPLGLIRPIITRAKILMQHLWRVQLSWDESVPQQIYSDWMLFRSELEQLGFLTIPRRALPKELHGMHRIAWLFRRFRKGLRCMCLSPLTDRSRFYHRARLDK